MQAEDIGDLDQPSQGSAFYCPKGPSFEDLIIVGKQVTIHFEDENPTQVKIEGHSQNIDELIEMNYSH